MKNASSDAIRDYLTRMSGILQDASKNRMPLENRGIYTIVSIIKKLASQDLPASPYADDSVNGSLEKVNYYIDVALKTFENIRGPMLNEEQKAKFLFALSETYETLGNYNAALSNYEKSEKYAAQLEDFALQGQSRYRLARILAERGEWDEAQKLLGNAVLALQTAGDTNGVALAQIELAKIAYRRGEYLQARKTFQAAQATCERVEDVRSRAVINNHLGVIQRMEDNDERAHACFQRALIEFQSIHDNLGAAEVLNNLGVVHYRRRELRKATVYFEKALQLSQGSGNFHLLAFIYLNKCELYIALGDLPMAASASGQALEILVRLKNPIGIAKTNKLIGRIFWKAGDLHRARLFYNESITLYDQFHIPLGLANCYAEYSRVLSELGEKVEAEEMSDTAQAILDTLNLQKRLDSKDAHEAKVVEAGREKAAADSEKQAASQ